MGINGQCHDLAALFLGNRPSTHCTGGWLGHGLVLLMPVI